MSTSQKNYGIYNNVYSWAEINTTKLRKNYRILRDHVAPSIYSAVLKADAYRLGAREIGEALFREGCRHFFVAYVDEADSLAKHLLEHCGAVPSYDDTGISQTSRSSPLQKYNLFVLDGPFVGNWCKEIAGRGYIPVLNTIENVSEWGDYARSINRQLAAILHIDTGLCRLGVPYNSIEELERVNTSGIRWAYFMSHFAASSYAAHPATALQLERVAKLRAKFPGIPFSLADTDGIFLGKHTFFDMVRVGVGVYGFAEYLSGMECCISVYSTVLQIQDIAPGTGVGYGWEFVAEKNMRVATISCGYADGVSPIMSAPSPRATNKFTDKAIINGKEAPVIWRNSMDLTTVDVTDIDLRVGDTAVIFGHPTQLAAAQKAGVTSHRRLIGLSYRVKRVYTQA
jgi:alanine racemase